MVEVFCIAFLLDMFGVGGWGFVDEIEERVKGFGVVGNGILEFWGRWNVLWVLRK